MSLLLTASQTVGPFVSLSFGSSCVDNLAVAGVSGVPAIIRGRVLDGDANPVGDAVIETWQANAHGKYAHPDDVQEKLLEGKFRGFGRVLTDGNGGFQLTTIKPGPVPGPGGIPQAPHVVVVVFMRGLLRHLVTRIYFPDEPANADDPVLKLVPAGRRASLIASKPAGGGDALEWNVVLQGPHETVFFDF